MSKSTLEKIESTVSWIRNQVLSAGLKGAMVGLSGGIDSAVVACLLKRAFPESCLGVVMPCKSSPRDAEDAISLANTIGMDYVTIDLTESHGLLYGKIQTVLEGYSISNERMADANLRARLRMTTLYGIGNSLGYMIAGTDNRAEIHTGYFTKYGDGGVDFVPICNLLKREVYEWAEILGVPQSIMDRLPSAGLWEGQTDEEEMGTTYAFIDDYLMGCEIPEKDRLIIERMHKVTAHKRVMPPGPPVF